MHKHHELNILAFSAYAALLLALFALIWGTLTRSQIILFEGVYSFISLALAGLYFFTAKSMTMGRDEIFPFGRAQMEPMVVVVHSIVLIVVCTKAFSSAVITLFSGGRDINNLSAMVYAIIGVTGCFISWRYILHRSKKKSTKSALIKTQAAEWFIYTMLNLAVLIGFFISGVIQHAGYWNYARYMDPLMVIIVVLFLIREPIVSFIDGIRGMLIMAPKKHIYNASKKVMHEIAKQRGFEDIILHLGKSGRELVYDVKFLAKDPNSSYSICEMDSIHKEIEDSLHKLFDNTFRLYVSFVHNRRHNE